MSKTVKNHKLLDYFDRTFFEVIDATDFMHYLYSGKFTEDLFYDVYELMTDYIQSDMCNSNLKKMAKKLYNSNDLFILTEERIELLIDEYEQSGMLVSR